MFKAESPKSLAEYTGPTNDELALNQSELTLGKALEVAFHNKDDIETVRKFVCEDKAPVKYRLSYGLEIQKETDFVYSLYVLLGEEKEAEQNIKLLPTRYQDIYAYVKTAKSFFAIFYAPSINLTPIAANPNFIHFLRDHALSYRSEPKDPDGSLTNSALIIAAGLRNHPLMEEIINVGKRSTKPIAINGAHVDYKGYFDEPAITWSAILLDEKGFDLLLSHGASFEDIGMMKSSVLHWIVSAIVINPTSERCEIGARMIQKAMYHGANPNHENLFAKRSCDYLQDQAPAIKALLATATSTNLKP